ncbi:biotin-dependent carboxyltransferase family protein [Algoriphagus namhaensis]|uniref:Biotin-dependent carboxyltransferase family protein n=1 Tax=Algoriphagus namhaensis TaxID=915353 RepID=A0ABV8ATJ2_9BACT
MIKDIGIIRILKTGPSSKIRDLGRMGYSAWGVPCAEPADRKAFIWNNHLLRNQKNDAQLEINQPGFEVQFSEPTVICFAGAKAEIKINNQLSSSFGIQQIAANDILHVGKFSIGSVLYVGIRGGFQSEIVMGSRSMFASVTSKAHIDKGDEVNFFTNMTARLSSSYARATYDTDYLTTEIISVYPGPEWHLLSSAQKQFLQSSKFHVSQMKNTMAVQLEELLPNKLSEMLTSPVFPGTVQLTPGGKLICLMQDAQVTGGYPRVLQLDTSEWNILAQKKPGSTFSFKII